MADNEISKRFIGDKKAKLVHDISKCSCTVDQEEAVQFDTVDEAHIAGYNNCPQCLMDLFINRMIWTPGAGPSLRGGTYVQKEAPRNMIQNKAIHRVPETK